MNTIYKVIHERMKERAGRARCLRKKDILVMFGRIYHIPEEYRATVLKEMIDLGMIKWDGENKKRIVFNIYD